MDEKRAVMIPPFSVCQKTRFFDRLPEVKEAPKTSISHASAYMDTVEGEMRSKSKPLRSKHFHYILEDGNPICYELPLYRVTPKPPNWF